jgi:isovaleryl-CoA dehydrogenase
MLPFDNLLGVEGGGLVKMMRNLEIERLGLSAISLGIAERCLDVMTRYASERRAFGQPIAEFGQIQRYIAESFAPPRKSPTRPSRFSVATVTAPKTGSNSSFVTRH